MHTQTAKVPTYHSPYQFPGGLVAKNRVALAPMTNSQSNEDGTLGDDEFLWLERRAAGGFGIVLTCAAHVSEESKGFAGELGVYADKHEPGLRRLADMGRAQGTLLLAQLFHGGVRSPSSLTGQQPLSASEFDLTFKNFERPRAATELDIARIIEDFASAAERCARCGFSGVELHGAHGYLITQFLSTQTNLRTDHWGGSLENRARFALNIARKTRAQLGPSKLLGIRLQPENGAGQEGLDFDEMTQVAVWLAEAGVDFIHLSLQKANKVPDKYPQSQDSIVSLLSKSLPKHVALIASGNIWTADDAENALLLGADFVSLGKAGIFNPDWPTKAHLPNFSPAKPPMDRAELRKLAIGEGMISVLELMRMVKKD